MIARHNDEHQNFQGLRYILATVLDMIMQGVRTCDRVASGALGASVFAAFATLYDSWRPHDACKPGSKLNTRVYRMLLAQHRHCRVTLQTRRSEAMSAQFRHNLCPTFSLHASGTFQKRGGKRYSRLKLFPSIEVSKPSAPL